MDEFEPENVKSFELSLVLNCKLGFHCPKIWGELEQTSNSGVRFCNVCDRGVYLAEDEESVALLAAAGKCVAYFPNIDDEPEFHVLGAYLPMSDVDEVPEDS